MSAWCRGFLARTQFALGLQTAKIVSWLFLVSALAACMAAEYSKAQRHNDTAGTLSLSGAICDRSCPWLRIRGCRDGFHELWGVRLWYRRDECGVAAELLCAWHRRLRGFSLRGLSRELIRVKNAATTGCQPAALASKLVIAGTPPTLPPTGSGSVAVSAPEPRPH